MTLIASFFASQIIEAKIIKGKLLDMTSLPAWVPKSLKTIIRTACNAAADNRFQTVADFSAKLNNIRKQIPDWRFNDCLCLFRKKKMFRIKQNAGSFCIEKKVNSTWRKERGYNIPTISDAVAIAETL